jgi:TonB-linked SusC/RagA family outer membrane protein
MKRLSAIVLSTMLWFSGMTLHAQTISGKVTSQEGGLPLAGVNVQIKGTSTGTITQPDGTFQLIAKENAKTLLFSYVGFDPQELKIIAGQQYNVTLKANNTALSEVVVLGYNTQLRKSVTGATGSIKAAAIRDIPAAGFNQLLQGKTTGVQVTSNSGAPGGGIFIRVRGTNSVNAGNDPLYILDGVFINNKNLVTVGMGGQVQSNPLADINSADIASIEVLKDANATAIYGSRGANGVVIITTKRGKTGKNTINFSTYQGWSTAAKKFKVATGPQIAELENERFLNDGGDPAALPFKPDEQPTYNRIDDLFRTAKTSDYEVSASGGQEKNNYFIGVGYYNQEAIVKPSKFERFSGRFNYDQQISKGLKVGTSTTIAHTKRNVSSNDNNPVGVINSALFPRSYLPVFNADGTYAKYGNFDNHLALIRELNNDASGWRVISNLYAEYNILPSLKFRSSWSVDFNDLYENNFNSTKLLAGQPKGNATSNLSRDITLLNEQVLSYSKGSVNALIGNTIQQNTFRQTLLNGQLFPSDNFTTIGSAATQTGSSSKAVARLVSFFGKAGYTYHDKYIVDVSVRADASSRFGLNKKWGYFPSAGVAWRLGEERFIRRYNIFDELKIRASYGLTGNQSGVSEYASQGLWQGGSNYLDQPGTAPFQLANPDLSWENTRQLNVGLDISVLQNRLNIEINYYDKYTDDLLLNVPVPRRSGYASILQNYGAVSNKGFELGINAVPINTKDFRWNLDFNISTNKNKIERLAAPITTGSRDIFRLQEGQSLYSFWLYKQQRVNPETGDAEYESKDKDNINVGDRRIAGNAWPDFQGGITNSFTYKGFDLNFFFYFEKGASIMNMNRYFLIHGGTQRNIGYFTEQLERWQKPGDITDIPRLTTNPTSNNYGGVVQSLSTRYLEDGSFLRLRTLSLGYTFHKGVRVYVQGTNLWTLTNYSGLDPEVNAQSATQNTKNFDWATIPQPRTLQIGANISF